MKKGISETEYQNNEASFFEGKEGYLLRPQKNVSGHAIKKHALIRIIKKMQYVRGKDIIHTNSFYVRDVRTGIEVGGVQARDIDLL